MLPSKLKPIRESRSGASLLTAIVMTAILLLMAGTTLYRVNTRCQTTYQSSRWGEALNTAEAGAELAINGLNTSGSLITITATSGTASTTGTFPAALMTSSTTCLTTSTTNQPWPFAIKYSGLLPAQGTAIPMYVSVLMSGSTTNGQTWYRIRSTGITAVPGTVGSGESGLLNLSGTNNHNKHLSMLRRLNFTYDRTGGSISLPQVSRTVEVCATSSSPAATALFPRLLTTVGAIDVNNAATFDSYDSTNPNKSINGYYVNGVYCGGQYPGKGAALTQHNGSIATDSSLNISVLATQSTPTIYGSVFADGGVWPPTYASPWYQNYATITGTVYTNFTTTFNPVPAPSLTPTIGTPSQIVSSTWVSSPTKYVGGATSSSPVNWVLNTNGINISNGANIELATASSGQGWFNIYINGPINLGGANIILDQGVHATFYVNGNISIGNNSQFNNVSGIPANLLIYGIDAAVDANTFSIQSSCNFIGTVYAPTWSLLINNNGDMMGGGVFHDANVDYNGGSGSMHYDESLSNASGSSSSSSSTYQASSWVEDIYSQKDNPATP